MLPIYYPHLKQLWEMERGENYLSVTPLGALTRWSFSHPQLEDLQAAALPSSRAISRQQAG